MATGLRVSVSFSVYWCRCWLVNPPGSASPADSAQYFIRSCKKCWWHARQVLGAACEPATKSKTDMGDSHVLVVLVRVTNGGQGRSSKALNWFLGLGEDVLGRRVVGQGVSMRSGNFPGTFISRAVGGHWVTERLEVGGGEGGGLGQICIWQKPACALLQRKGRRRGWSGRERGGLTAGGETVA